MIGDMAKMITKAETVITGMEMQPNTGETDGIILMGEDTIIETTGEEIKLLMLIKLVTSVVVKLCLDLNL